MRPEGRSPLAALGRLPVARAQGRYNPVPPLFQRGIALDTYPKPAGGPAEAI